MQLINWQQYWITVLTLMVLYYLTVYVLFFRDAKRRKNKAEVEPDIQSKNDVAVQKENQEAMR